MKISKTFLIASSLMLATITGYSNPPDDGKTIFTTRCAGCHNVNKVLTGPALAGIHERRSIDWIVKFVKSSQTVVRSGDKDAVAIYQKFNKVPMPDHPDLSDANIKSIVDYIKSATVIVDTKAPFAKPGKLMTPYRPLSISKDYLLFIIFLSIVALLIMVMLLAVRQNDLRQKADDQGLQQ